MSMVTFDTVFNVIEVKPVIAFTTGNLGVAIEALPTTLSLFVPVGHVI